MTNAEKEYQDRYGHLSFDSDELLAQYAREHKIDFEYIQKEEERIQNIPWHTMEFVFPVVPKASPRPRYSSATKSFYVKGAAANKKLLRKYIETAGIICTRVEFNLDIYLPIPSSMTVAETYLAEKRVILPIQTPDFDNAAKTYSDVLQDILIINDNIINPGIINKYYSLKPRVHIILRYQDDFDCEFNRKKVERSIAYVTMDGKDIRDAKET